MERGPSYVHFFHSYRQKAQGLVEYAVILGLVAIVAIAVLRLLGPKIGGTFSSINNALGGVAGYTAAYADWRDAQNEYCATQPSGTLHDMYQNLDDDLWIAGPNGGVPPAGYIDRTDTFQYDTCP